MTRIDPITLSVLWNALVSIADEMGVRLRNTAFSDAVREGEDYSTGLFDRNGRLVAQGNFTPGHLGSMPYVVEHVLRQFPAGALQAGDAVLLNDSALGSGHFPDLFLVSPIFFGSELIGYGCNCAQHVDIGGIAPGGQQVPGVTEAFQEGLRIQPVKMFRAGRIDPDLERLLLGNVRMPERVRGDLYAQYNANLLGSARLSELWHAYGRALVEDAIDDILDETERQIRAEIGNLEPGTYRFSDCFDDHGPGTEMVAVNVAVTTSETGITIDFRGSSDQVPAAVNCYLNYTRAYAMFAVRVFTDPHVPQNAGAFRVVNVVAPPGSFFNAGFPAPSGGRATCQIRIFEAIAGALAQARPDRAIAAFSHWGNPNIGGVDAQGRPFVLYDLLFGGYGARPDSDGQEALCPVMNARNIPVEVHEANNPVRIERLELVADTGGAGQHRGGCAIVKSYRLLEGSATLTNLGDRHRIGPFGLNGGRRGTVAISRVCSRGEEHVIGSKSVHHLEPGDVLTLQLAGAGGYGDPMCRDPELVLRDVRDGFVSAAHALHEYGVVLNVAGDAVDEEATRHQRNQRGSLPKER